MVESEETGYLPKVKFMAWLGDGSFSMYAFHYPILISIREMGATTYQSAMVLMLLSAYYHSSKSPSHEGSILCNEPSNQHPTQESVDNDSPKCLPINLDLICLITHP